MARTPQTFWGYFEQTLKGISFLFSPKKGPTDRTRRAYEIWEIVFVKFTGHFSKKHGTGIDGCLPIFYTKILCEVIFHIQIFRRFAPDCFLNKLFVCYGKNNIGCKVYWKLCSQCTIWIKFWHWESWIMRGRPKYVTEVFKCKVKKQ